MQDLVDATPDTRVSVAVEDFNGDGRLDVVLVDGATGKVQYFKHTGQSAFELMWGTKPEKRLEPGTIAFSRVPSSLNPFDALLAESAQPAAVATDFDSDGVPELIVGAALKGQELTRFAAKEDGSAFTPSSGEAAPFAALKDDPDTPDTVLDFFYEWHPGLFNAEIDGHYETDVRIDAFRSAQFALTRFNDTAMVVVGLADGTLRTYVNSGTATTPKFVELTDELGASDPFANVYCPAWNTCADDGNQVYCGVDDSCKPEGDCSSCRSDKEDGGYTHGVLLGDPSPSNMTFKLQSTAIPVENWYIGHDVLIGDNFTSQLYGTVESYTADRVVTLRFPLADQNREHDRKPRAGERYFIWEPRSWQCRHQQQGGRSKTGINSGLCEDPKNATSNYCGFCEGSCGDGYNPFPADRQVWRAHDPCDPEEYDGTAAFGSWFKADGTTMTAEEMNEMRSGTDINGDGIVEMGREWQSDGSVRTSSSAALLPASMLELLLSLQSVVPS